MRPNRSLDQVCLRERAEEYSCRRDSDGALMHLLRDVVHDLSPLWTEADTSRVNLGRRL
jgi:hypothetical protein